MLFHIIKLYWREDLSAEVISDSLANMGQLLSIPGVTAIDCGKVCSPPEGDEELPDQVMIMQFVDRKAFDDFMPHPVHVAVADVSLPLLRKVSMMQVDV